MSASLLSSCMKDKLTNNQLTVVTKASSFDTEARVNNQLLGLYTVAKSGSFLGGRAVVAGEIRGGEYDLQETNLVLGTDVYNLNVANNATVPNSIWSQGYYAINSANLFLEGMTAKGSSVVGPALSARFIAEARLVRAVSYLTLIQFFARPYAVNNGNTPGIPLRLVGISGSGQSALPRSTVAQVYAQILADLDFAEQNLLATNGSAAANTTRPHKNTAIALKTRVYLAMQNYPKVVEEANKIVPAIAPFTASSGVAHTLQTNIADVFKTPYTTTESIFSLPMTVTAGDFPTTQTQIGFHFYYGGAAALGAAVYPLKATGGIVSNAGWRTTDARRAFIVTAPAPSGKLFFSKFSTRTTAYTDWVPVIRWAEVLLNLAEAKARISTAVADPQGIALLNAVRRRSDAT
ncbi:MAG: RagB/SusD family nutrient uptake outer membrane protein, partial [Pedobacter sp.]